MEVFALRSLSFVLRSLPVPASGQGDEVQYSLCPERRVALRDKGRERLDGLLDGGRLYVGVCPFAKSHSRYKEWGVDATVDFIKMAREKYKERLCFVLIGGRENLECSERIEKEVLDSSPCETLTFFNYIKHEIEILDVAEGSESLGMLFEVMSAMDYVVTVDTGTLHLAEFLGIPSFGLYGPTWHYETGPSYCGEYREQSHDGLQLRRSTSDGPIDKSVRVASLEPREVLDKVDDHFQRLDVIEELPY